MRLKKFFLWTMIVSLLAAAGMGVIALLSPFGQGQERILLTSLLAGAFGLTTLMCAVVLERGRMKELMRVGIGFACVALTAWMSLVWGVRSYYSSPNDLILQIAGIASILTVLIAHVGLMGLPVMRRTGFRFARLATQALAAFLALILILLIMDYTAVTEMFGGEVVILRLIGVIAILDVAGTITVPLLARIESHQRHDGEETTIANRPKIRLECPRCARPQEIRAGKSKCAGCGLGFAIEVEEPRCSCGYLLYGLAGNKCPECGKEIAEGKRWASARGIDEPEAQARV